MDLINVVKSVLKLKKKIDIKILPSQGLFYKDDFGIKIKRAELEDISDYETNFISDDIGLIIYKIKKIVKKNIIFKGDYSFNDLKSIDIVYLFLEIVKFTKDKKIILKKYDENSKSETVVEFGSKYFNYFKIEEELMKSYDSVNKCFDIDGYKYSLPSIGIEDSLTNFLINKSYLPNSKIYSEYFYDFTNFILDKNTLSISEIDNLVQIFNFDIDKGELNKIKKIVKMFSDFQKYSLIKNGKIVEIDSKINLESIWK